MTSNRRSLILLPYVINRIANCFPIETLSSDKIVSWCFSSSTTMTTTITTISLLLTYLQFYNNIYTLHLTLYC